ncbi:hypothetical protein ABZ917_10930 [Nonomuraea wenchangensis]
MTAKADCPPYYGYQCLYCTSTHSKLRTCVNYCDGVGWTCWTDSCGTC